jgi:hypothetical protein
LVVAVPVAVLVAMLPGLVFIVLGEN